MKDDAETLIGKGCACGYDGEKITSPCALHADWARGYNKGADIVEATALPIERPIPMLLWCPSCFNRHIDVGAFEHKHHHTHACQFCGFVWRPAVVYTVGVQFLPGFKDDEGGEG